MSFYRIQYVVVAGFMIFALFCETIGELFQDVGNLVLASPVVLYLVVINSNRISKMKDSAKKFFIEVFLNVFSVAVILFMIPVAFIALIVAIVGCVFVALLILAYYVYDAAFRYVKTITNSAAQKRRFSLESFVVDVLDTQDPYRPAKGAIMFLVKPDVIDPDDSDLVFHGANVEVEDLKAARKNLDMRINHHNAMSALSE